MFNVSLPNLNNIVLKMAARMKKLYLSYLHCLDDNYSLKLETMKKINQF